MDFSKIAARVAGVNRPQTYLQDDASWEKFSQPWTHDGLTITPKSFDEYEVVFEITGEVQRGQRNFPVDGLLTIEVKDGEYAGQIWENKPLLNLPDEGSTYWKIVESLYPMFPSKPEE